MLYIVESSRLSRTLPVLDKGFDESTHTLNLAWASCDENGHGVVAMR
jgi:hypothetical protein